MLGLFGARWRAGDLSQLAEWGLGGRRFGTVITWFLLGGDLYTAYTFIAVPALMFGARRGGLLRHSLRHPDVSAAVPVFPAAVVGGARHGYVTAADFVRGRFDNRPLALAVALTGIIATMPYIALQLVGMQVVIAALGLNYAVTLPLLGKVSAAAAGGLPGAGGLHLYQRLARHGADRGGQGSADLCHGAGGGDRDPRRTGRLWQDLRQRRSQDSDPGAMARRTIWAPGFAYVSLALGSTLALFMYPHAVTGLLSSSSRHVVRRNAMMLPAYSMALALIALLGYMAVAAGVKGDAGLCRRASPASATISRCRRCSCHVSGLVRGRGLCRHRHRRAGARLDDGDRLRQSFHPQYLQGFHQARLHAAPGGARRQAGFAVDQAGGAVCSCWNCRPPTPSSCNCWAASGSARPCRRCCWRLYVRLNPWGLLAGWAAGMAAGTWMAWTLEFKSSTYVLHFFGVTVPCYAALSALVLNLAVAVAREPDRERLRRHARRSNAWRERLDRSSA